MEELLGLGGLHDPARLLVGLDSQALLIPADRLGFLLQRGDEAGEGAGVGAEFAGRLVILIDGQRGNLVAKRGVAQPG